MKAIPMLVAVLVLVLGVSICTAQAPPMPPTTPTNPRSPGTTALGGWPEQYAGQPNITVRPHSAYYVWFDQHGWHVRFTTPLVAVFSGSVTTDGKFQGVSGATVQGTVLAFLRPGVGRAGGGFDFTTTGNVLNFSLQINRQQAHREQVYTGRKGQHPGRVPFVVTRSGQTYGIKPAQDPTWERPRPCGGGPCD